MDIRGFFAALTGDWVVLMSGIASVVLTIVSLLRRWQSVPRWAIIAAAIVCFLLASCRIWTTEHRARLDAEKKLEQSQPNLAGEILQINRHPLQRVHEPKLGVIGTGVLLVVRIRNLGSDSIADNYSVSASVGGKRVNGETHAIPNSITLHNDNGTTSPPFYGVDAIYDKTYSEPIKKGGSVTGIIWVWFRDVDVSGLYDKGLELRFHDVNGHEYTVNTNPNGNNNLQHFPGLSVSPDTSSKNQTIRKQLGKFISEADVIGGSEKCRFDQCLKEISEWEGRVDRYLGSLDDSSYLDQFRSERQFAIGLGSGQQRVGDEASALKRLLDQIDD